MTGRCTAPTRAARTAPRSPTGWRVLAEPAGHGRLGVAAARRQRPGPRRARAAARRRGVTPRPPTSSAPSSASGPRCAGCSRSASRSAAPAAARPASSAASTTRASTTGSATCWRSTPPGCWSAARCSRPSASTSSSRCSATTSTSAGARPAPATAPSSCPTPSSSTSRPRTAASASTRSGRPATAAASGRPRSTRCWSTAAPGRCRSWWSGCSSAASCAPSGLLLVRAPGEAVDELAGLVADLPAALAGPRPAAGDDGAASTVPPRQVRPCSRRPGCPTGTASTSCPTSPPPSSSRPATSPPPGGRARAAAAETGPVSEDAQNLPEDTGLLARLVTCPVAWVFAVLVRRRPRRRPRPGRRRLPVRRRAAPGARRARSTGGTCTSPPGTTSAPARARPPRRTSCRSRSLGTLLLGQGLAARRRALPARRAAGRARRLPLPAAGHLLAADEPVGRRGVRRPAGRHRARCSRAVSARSSARWCCPGWRTPRCSSAPATTADRRRRAAWRTALWLALLDRVRAGRPGCWPLVVAVVALAVALRGRSAQGLAAGVAIPLVATLVLLLPWSVATWTHQGPASWLFEAGLPVPRLTEGAHPAGVPCSAAPGRRRPGLDDRRRRARRGRRAGPARHPRRGAARLGRARRGPRAGRGPAPAGSLLDGELADRRSRSGSASRWSSRRRPRSPPRRWPAPASAAGSPGASFGWRQPVGVLVVALAALTPVVSAVWWVWSGSDGPARPRPRHRRSRPT